MTRTCRSQRVRRELSGSVSRNGVNDECLRDHLHGRLPSEEEAQLIEHLDSCGRCQATLESVAGDTVILAIARESGQKAPTHDPTLNRLLMKLQGYRGDTADHVGAADDLDSAMAPEHIERLGHYTVLGIA